jgi:hypothetical protein
LSCYNDISWSDLYERIILAYRRDYYEMAPLNIDYLSCM